VASNGSTNAVPLFCSAVGGSSLILMPVSNWAERLADLLIQVYEKRACVSLTAYILLMF
jgi:hypothetical protein